jgi:hypothetical protein
LTKVAFLRLAGVVCALAIGGIANAAAAADPIDCAFDQLDEDQRNALGDASLTLLVGQQVTSVAPELTQAQRTLDAAMRGCSAANLWSDAKADIALNHTITKMMLDSMRYHIGQLNGDVAAADLFFAQNKYQILDEEAAGLSSKDWVTTRLLELGFAKKGSRALDAVWIYYSLLFQLDTKAQEFSAVPNIK